MAALSPWHQQRSQAVPRRYRPRRFVHAIARQEEAVEEALASAQGRAAAGAPPLPARNAACAPRAGPCFLQHLGNPAHLEAARLHVEARATPRRTALRECWARRARHSTFLSCTAPAAPGWCTSSCSPWHVHWRTLGIGVPQRVAFARVAVATYVQTQRVSERGQTPLNDRGQCPSPTVATHTCAHGGGEAGPCACVNQRGTAPARASGRLNRNNTRAASMIAQHDRPLEHGRDAPARPEDSLCFIPRVLLNGGQATGQCAAVCVCMCMCVCARVCVCVGARACVVHRGGGGGWLAIS